MGTVRNGFTRLAQRAASVCCVLMLVPAGRALCAEAPTPSDAAESLPAPQAATPSPLPAPEPAASVVPPAPEHGRFVFGEYRIQAGDRLRMSFWGEPSLTTDTMVMTHGRVPFPLLGELSAGDKTVSELTEDVRKGYLRYYRDPQVTLLVTPAVWPSVYVQGDVRSPGPVDYSPGRRVLDYVGLAGGFLADADLSRVGIVSRSSDTTSTTTVDMSPVAFESESVPNPELKPGDTIWVGRALPVSILGAVNRPGAVDYQHALRLSDYVGMAGGPTNRAEVDSVTVKHTSPDGAVSVARVNLAAALARPEDPKGNPVLAPGDTVNVPEVFVGGTLEWSDLLRAVAGVIIWR